MLTIGLLSDTHGWLDPEVFKHFETCDEIWHAGDIGNRKVLQELQAFKPVIAVYGNIDDQDIRIDVPLTVRQRRGDVDIFMTHIGGAPGRLSLPIRSLIEQNRPDLFICGHSHLLKIVRDPVFHPMIHLNPGASGKHGIHTIRTIVRFKVDMGKIYDMEVIHLGERSPKT